MSAVIGMNDTFESYGHWVQFHNEAMKLYPNQTPYQAHVVYGILKKYPVVYHGTLDQIVKGEKERSDQLRQGREFYPSLSDADILKEFEKYPPGIKVFHLKLGREIYPNVSDEEILNSIKLYPDTILVATIQKMSRTFKKWEIEAEDIKKEDEWQQKKSSIIFTFAVFTLGLSLLIYLVAKKIYEIYQERKQNVIGN